MLRVITALIPLISLHRGLQKHQWATPGFQCRDGQERFAEAEALYRQVLAIKEKLFEADHIEIALTLHNLAMLYTALARDDEAAALLHRALAIFTRTVSDDHPHVRACREHLAALRGKRPG